MTNLEGYSLKIILIVFIPLMSLGIFVIVVVSFETKDYLSLDEPGDN